MIKKLLILLCFGLAVLILTPNFSAVYAQEGQNQEQKAQEGAASKGKAEDSNITKEEKPNDKNSKAQPPGRKGGTAKGGSCEVQLDNWTPWNIKVYIDGAFQGTIAAYSESYTYTVPGRVRVYGRADFVGGDYLYWGPRDYRCGPDQYIYFKMTE